MNLAKRLIDEATAAGCDAVKFQKRNIELVYTPEELASDRKSPWGEKYFQQKRGLEFNREQYDEIDAYCRKKNIQWFASAWDLDSQEFLRSYNLKFNKVASPMLTVTPLLHKIAEERKTYFYFYGDEHD